MSPRPQQPYQQETSGYSTEQMPRVNESDMTQVFQRISEDTDVTTVLPPLTNYRHIDEPTPDGQFTASPSNSYEQPQYVSSQPSETKALEPAGPVLRHGVDQHGNVWSAWYDPATGDRVSGVETIKHNASKSVEPVMRHGVDEHGNVWRAYYDPETGRPLSNVEFVDSEVIDPRRSSGSNRELHLVEGDDGILDVHIRGRAPHVQHAAHAASVFINGHSVLAPAREIEQHQYIDQPSGNKTATQTPSFTKTGTKVEDYEGQTTGNGGYETPVKANWLRTTTGKKLMHIVLATAIVIGGADVGDFVVTSVKDTFGYNVFHPTHWLHPELKLGSLSPARPFEDIETIL